MTLPTTMRAAAIDRFGEAEELKLQEVAVPTPGPDEILIRVEYAGVGIWDAAQRAGQMADMSPASVNKLPRVLGADGSGTVAAVGAGVTGFVEGEKVYASGLFNPKGGFYAEYTAIPADAAGHVPAGLAMDQAGALGGPGATALTGLDDALKLEAGQNLLIFGASGGVGQPAVQLAKAIGARVLAVVASADGAAVARDGGADVVVNSKTDDLGAAITAFAPAGLDAVLAFINGDGLDTAIAAVRAGGRVAHPNGVQPAPTGGPNVDVIAFDGVANRAVIDRLNSLIESRPFAVEISGRFALADVAKAQLALKNHRPGRPIVTIG